MAASLSQEQRDKLKEAFDFFDKDGNGHIDPSELGAVLKHLGQNPSDAEVAELIREADSDGNGKIDFDEFAALVAKKLESHH